MSSLTSQGKTLNPCFITIKGLGSILWLVTRFEKVRCIFLHLVPIRQDIISHSGLQMLSKVVFSRMKPILAMASTSLIHACIFESAARLDSDVVPAFYLLGCVITEFLGWITSLAAACTYFKRSICVPTISTTGPKFFLRLRRHF